LKILVAEDKPKLLCLCKFALEDNGHKVVSTTNGLECIEAYMAELKMRPGKNAIPAFDVVLLDYGMPRKNGVETAKEIIALCPTQKLLMLIA
jgi:CheY-like chemotaxis protein